MYSPRNALQSALRFEAPCGRLPAMEWAKWWEVTIDRWITEGLPDTVPEAELGNYLGLDKFQRIRYRCVGKAFPDIEFGKGIITDYASYAEIKDRIFDREQVKNNLSTLEKMKALQQAEGMITWVGIDGFFWLGRELLGIEEHLYSFYDEPDLLKRINYDLLEYNKFLLDETFKIIKPDFVTLAEDMSYNNGPMISEDIFDEFIKPYYLELIPCIKDADVLTFVDTDGDVLGLIRWLVNCGVQGILPLERQAGVDVAEIRRQYPNLLMMGGFDKTIMRGGQAAMVAEFERLLPVMRSGGFIPTVDHQTPPDVSFEQYLEYVLLLKDYCGRAADSGEWIDLTH